MKSYETYPFIHTKIGTWNYRKIKDKRQLTFPIITKENTKFCNEKLQYMKGKKQIKETLVKRFLMKGKLVKPN